MDQISIKRALPTDSADIAVLYQEGEWWESSWDMGLIKDIITCSYLFLTAVQNEVVVGMGRIISDGVSDAYLQDIFVTESMRGRGIGTNLVSALLDACRDAGIGWIGIIAAPETEYFYRRFGFARMGGFTSMRYEGRLKSLDPVSHANKTH